MFEKVIKFLVCVILGCIALYCLAMVFIPLLLAIGMLLS